MPAGSKYAHRSFATSPAKINKIGKRSSHVRCGTKWSTSPMNATANSSHVTPESAYSAQACVFNRAARKYQHDFLGLSRLQQANEQNQHVLHGMGRKTDELPAHSKGATSPCMSGEGSAAMRAFSWKSSTRRQSRLATMAEHCRTRASPCMRYCR